MLGEDLGGFAEGVSGLQDSRVGLGDFRTLGEPLVDPVTRVIVEILDRIPVLPRCGLATNARSLSVLGAFNDDEILVFGSREFVMDLVVADEIVGAHRRHQQRHADSRQVTRG